MCVFFLGKCFYFIPKIKAEVTATNDVKDIMPDIMKYMICSLRLGYILWIIKNLGTVCEKFVLISNHHQKPQFC